MKFSVKVPATTANLGPGFDSAGIALSLYNLYHFDFSVTTGITFSDSQYHFDDCLTLDIFFKTLTLFHHSKPTNLHLLTESNIPIAKGLGSSSACVVAGIFAANYYGQLNLTPLEIAHIATQFEGHPDNVTPAVFGNLCVSIYDQDTFVVRSFSIHPSLRFGFIYPQQTIHTDTARALLPATYSLDSIVYSLSRAALLINAFQTADIALLKTVTKDKLHQPYREPLIHNCDQLYQILDNYNAICSWVSGSGPTLCAVFSDKHFKSDTSCPITMVSVDTVGTINL